MKRILNPKVKFLKEYGIYFIVAGKAYGFDWKILASQSALETGWGRYVKGNNLFNIKNRVSIFDMAYGRDEKTEFLTHEYIEGKKVHLKDSFEGYANPLESIIDYVFLIKRRYPKAYELRDGRDPLRYFEELKKGGYATDPNYARKCYAVYRSVERTVRRIPTVNFLKLII